MRTFNFQFNSVASFEDIIESQRIQKADTILVQAFVGQTNPGVIKDIQSSVNEYLPQAVLIGATSAGSILNGALVPQTPVLSVSVFEKASLATGFITGHDESQIASYLAEKAVLDDTKLMILFSDGMKTNGENIINNLYSLTPHVVVAGGRAGDGAFQQTFIFNNTEITESGAVAACLNGDINVVNRYFLNWQPIGKTMTVTDVDVNILKSIDGRPVKEIYSDYLGAEVGNSLPGSNAEFPLIKLGPNEQHIARAFVSMTPEGYAVLAGNMEVGDEVRFSHGNVDMLVNKTNLSASEIAGYKPEAIFAYSCGARLGFLGGKVELELAPFAKLAPNAGFFTFGEYFSSGESYEMLNVTLTVVGISEQDHDKVAVLECTEGGSQNRQCMPDGKDDMPVNHFLGAQSRVLHALVTLTNKVANELKEAHKQVISSIQYASRIQRSVLAKDSDFAAMFDDYFIIWEPRDTVGGDMLITSQSWGNGDLAVLGDCTGHGVPGAFVTMLATGAFEQAMMTVKPGDLSKLMQTTHRILQKTMGQDHSEGESDDGLELGVCYIPSNGGELQFCGARIDLFIVKDSHISVIKGTKKGLGYRGIPTNQTYMQHEVHADTQTSFYLTTDGFVDQVGGPDNRMFGKKRLRELLTKINELSMDEQKPIIQAAFENYQNKQRRRDDVTMLGFRLNGK